MSRPLEALAEREPDGGWLVRSPRVGVYRNHPRRGALRPGAQAIGTLAVLGRSHPILLPGEVEGRIDELLVAGSTTPVEYGQALLRLAPPGGARAGETLVDVSAGAEADDPIPEGCFAVASPIDGVFYRSPSPGAPPFVEPGSIVHAGSTLGLVEAMKSFNAVTYGGPGLPARAQVAEVRAADAADVRQGAVLFVVRPASGR